MAAAFDPLTFGPIVHLSEAVARDRLIDHVRLATPGTARLTLLLAPAGFGKTTVMAQIAARATAMGERVAWLNCGPQDREPIVFVENIGRAFIAAGATGMQVGMGLSDMLASLAGAGTPVTLFVDRFEVASGTAIDPLLGTLAKLLPVTTRVVVGSRFPPTLGTTALQIEGYLRTVTVDALRFTDAEARALLRPLLSHDDAEHVIVRAAGWPLVLQLARLQRATGGAPALQSSAADSLPLRELFDYVVAEVLSTLHDGDVDFLVDVSVLETFDVATANAVRDRADSAQRMDRLKAMKPIIVVDERPLRATLHPLLRDLLLGLLERDDTAGRTASLHVRAARHFAAAGLLHEAVSHAALGGRFDFAADILANAGGIGMLIDQGVGRVKMLLALLPVAVVQKHPRLRLVRILQLLLEENGLEARLELDRMTAHLEATGEMPMLDEATRLDLVVVEALMSVNDAEHVFRFAPWSHLDHAIERARSRYCEDPRYLVLTLAVELTLLQRYGPLERAERVTAEIDALHREGPYSYNEPWTWIYQARNQRERGNLAAAKANLTKALGQELDIFTFTHGSFGQMVHALLGRVCLDQGHLDEALQHFEAVAPAKPMTLFEIHCGVHVDYARCEFARGNSSRALDLLARARQFASDENLPHLEVLAAANEIQMLVTMDRYDDAIRVGDESSIEHVLSIASRTGALPLHEVDDVVTACFCLALVKGRDAKALRIARDAVDAAVRAGRRPAELQAWLLTARAGDAHRDGAVTRAAIDHALAIGSATGIVEPFLWAGPAMLPSLRQVAEAQRHPHAAWAAHIVSIADERLHAHPTIDSRFTPRERDVVRGLIRGQPTKLIARELLLSPETVKHHLKGIFSKLGVRSRDEAVEEIRRRASH